MIEQEQLISIAEACGWMRKGDYWYGHGYEKENPPDYLHDLNAVKEVRKSLSSEQRELFCAILHGMVKTTNRMLSNENLFHCIDASAATQIEAFLRAIGKWKD